VSATSTSRPSEPVVLLGLSGSLRRDSANTALLRAAAELAPAGVEVVLHPLRDLPFFDADVERAGLPDPVRALRTAVEDADGLLLATPEYNWSVTAALKNAIDWASRGPDAPLDRKPAALLSAAGRGGGARALAHLRDILGHNRVDVVDREVRVPRGAQHVVDGALATPEHRDQVRAVVDDLVTRIRADRQRRSDAA
jgi:chromate reductase, NAD(P)H dehydrogenase (quinone)